MFKDRFFSFYEMLPFNAQFFEALPLEFLIIMLFLAGFSQAVGHSGVLFINKVKPPQFILSLLSATLLYLARMSLWLGIIWFMMSYVKPTPVETLATALILSRFPQLFAFLEFLPLVGIAQAWKIAVVGLGLAIYATSYFADISLLTSSFVILLSWLLITTLRYYFSQKLIDLREAAAARITGRPLFKEKPDVQDLLLEIMVADGKTS